MIRSVSIRSRLVLLVGLTVLFWFLCSLILADRVNRILSFDSSRKEITSLRSNITRLNLESEKLIGSFNAFYEGSINELSNDKIEEICIDLNASIQKIESDRLVSENIVLLRSIKDAADNVEEIKRLSGEFVALFFERGDLGTGLLKQWHNKLLSVQNLRKDSFSSRGAQFVGKISDFSMAYLIKRDSDELEKLIDLWKTERNILIPENSAGTESEIVLNDFFESTVLLATLNRQAGSVEGRGLRSEINFYLLRVSEIAENLETESELYYQKYSSRMLLRFILLILVVGGLFFIVFYRILSVTKSSLFLVKKFLNEMKSGKIPQKLILRSSDDFESMADSLNKHVESLERKISFADQIGESGIQNTYEPEGKDDVLGNSLLKMADRLRKAEHEESIHKKSEEKRRWLSEGMAGFGEIFRSERENLEELSFKVIKNLVTYIDAIQGAIYLNNTEEETPVVDLLSAFAYDRRKYINRRIQYGEGLVGTCALEKETIYLTEIPQDYFEITSGIGQAKPQCLLIVPLKLENELFGILEIASFRILEPHETGFVEQLGESIATTMAAVRINEKTARLLEKSQKQAEEMARQEEKMKANVHELQVAQEESQRKETEITGILNAVNTSSLVAEYSTSGRFSDINEKFLFLLESSRDQIIGKHHSDFSLVDKYSPEYKDFWKRLRDGETISQSEHFRLFSGSELWLNQTYTPILDRSGKPYKILNIAHDITKSRKQQEALEAQANEIIRRSLEMETLSSAVDSSIIKCELSPDGVIMDANNNYLEAVGYTKREVLGKNIRLFLNEIEKQQFDKIWMEVLKEKTYTGVIRRTKPTGEEVWLMSTFSPVKNEDATIYKTYFLAHDVTEKKLKYQLLEDANQEIDRLRQQIQESENH